MVVVQEGNFLAGEVVAITTTAQVGTTTAAAVVVNLTWMIIHLYDVAVKVASIVAATAMTVLKVEVSCMPSSLSVLVAVVVRVGFSPSPRGPISRSCQQHFVRCRCCCFEMVTIGFGGVCFACCYCVVCIVVLRGFAVVAAVGGIGHASASRSKVGSMVVFVMMVVGKKL